MATKTELAEANRRIDELTEALEQKHGHLVAQEKETALMKGRYEELAKVSNERDKELKQAKEDRSRLERNLSRALGYIDRVLEAERPEITQHSVGDVCTETNNYHGPQMEEPPIQHDGLPGLRRSW